MSNLNHEQQNKALRLIHLLSLVLEENAPEFYSSSPLIAEEGDFWKEIEDQRKIDKHLTLKPDSPMTNAEERLAHKLLCALAEATRKKEFDEGIKGSISDSFQEGEEMAALYLGNFRDAIIDFLECRAIEIEDKSNNS